MADTSPPLIESHRMSHAPVSYVACPNVYLEVCYSQLTRRQLEEMVHAIGYERGLMGTAMPFIDPAFTVAKVVCADLPAEQRRAILGGNAERLLRANGALAAMGV